jgi:oligopeptide/dipeptide ABC transporter ATP-binding protein
VSDPAGLTEPSPLLEIDGLRKSFRLRGSFAERFRLQRAGEAVAVDGVSLSIARSETLGIVGESGSGKTTLGRCLIRLVAPDAGTVKFAGTEITSADRGELQKIRRRIQMVFQDPYSSLNPRLKAGQTIVEPALVHGLVERRGAKAHVAEMLALVGLPERTAESYPRQLSGGQRQRVAIARAISVRPEVLIADEAVSALDVSVQAQILNLLGELVETLDLTMIFIAHQLAVVRHVSDRVAIMYVGKIVELAPVESIFTRAQHPYTHALLEAAPRPNPEQRRTRPALSGDVPSLLQLPTGCRFRTRCSYAQAICEAEEPELRMRSNGHLVACHVLPFEQPRLEHSDSDA